MRSTLSLHIVAALLASTLVTAQSLSLQVADKSAITSSIVGKGPPMQVELVGNAEQFGTFSAADFGLSAGAIISTGKVLSLVSSEGSAPGLEQQMGHDFSPRGAEGDSASLLISFEGERGSTITFKFVTGYTDSADDASAGLPPHIDSDALCMVEAFWFSAGLFKDDTVIKLNGENIIGSAREIETSQDTSVLSASFKVISKLYELSATLNEGRNLLNMTCADTLDGFFDSFILIGAQSVVVLPVVSPYSWRASAWLECSVTCGQGRQLRQVTCEDKDGNSVDQSMAAQLCTETKPNAMQLCDGSCDKTTPASLIDSAPTVTPPFSVETKTPLAPAIEPNGPAVDDPIPPPFSPPPPEAAADCPAEHVARIIAANDTYKTCFSNLFEACHCRVACDCLAEYAKVVQPCENSSVLLNGSLADIHAQYREDAALCEVSAAGGISRTFKALLFAVLVAQIIR